MLFRAMIRDPQTGTWSMSDDSKHPLLAPEGTTWEHLQFSGVGIDLAVADSHGSVYVYTLVGALGKMPLAPSNITRGDIARSDLDAIVGMHWLPVYPTDFKVSLLLLASETHLTNM